jgi:hypothetical protein
VAGLVTKRAGNHDYSIVAALAAERITMDNELDLMLRRMQAIADDSYEGYAVAETVKKWLGLVTQLRQEQDELREVLVEAVDLIRQWHNMDTAGLLTKAQHEMTWKIYQDKSPEMKRINAALAARRGH